MEGKHILITGGAGFIGTHLVQALCEHNRVRVLDTMFRDALSNTEWGQHPNVEVLKGDVCKPEDVALAMKEISHVVHLAAIAGVDTVIKNAVDTMKIALLGTYHVLEEAKKHSQIECVVDFSTSEVFGNYAFNVHEGDVTSLGAVGEARWTYAVSKLATEHLAHNYFKSFGLPTCSIRPFNIFGPNQVGEGAVHKFVQRAIRGETLEVHNGGNQIRSWCYITDIIDGILLSLEKPEALGKAFNIGNPQNTVTIYYLAKEVVRLAKSSSEISSIHWPEQDVELRIPNIDRARELLGYEPKIDLEKGIEKTIHWYRSRM